jgi:hypothetical protein
MVTQFYLADVSLNVTNQMVGCDEPPCYPAWKDPLGTQALVLIESQRVKGLLKKL